MREIKFRAWHPDQGKIIYFKSFKEIVKWQQSDEYRVENSQYKCTTYMQYTGMIDRNGAEVYEGDILKYVLEDGEGDIGVVKMSDNGFWIVEIKEIEDFDPLCDWLDGKIKILGNIYENPELLEVNNTL